MGIREIVGYARRPGGLLGRLSKGHGGRASLVLIGFHLALVVVCALLWLVSLAPLFDGASWVPGLLGLLVLVGGSLWLMLAFGFWGVGLNSGQDGGDQFEDDFTPGAAIGLGWLRWALQVVTIGLCFILVLMTWAGVRWWHLASTDEIDAVPAKAAAITVPGDWNQTDTVHHEPELGEHNGSYTRSLDLPEGYTYADVREWFGEATWADSFGRLEGTECSTDIEQCTADVVAAEDEEMTYSLEVWYHESSVEALPPSVRITLEYVVP